MNERTSSGSWRRRFLAIACVACVQCGGHVDGSGDEGPPGFGAHFGAGSSTGNGGGGSGGTGGKSSGGTGGEGNDDSAVGAAGETQGHSDWKNVVPPADVPSLDDLTVLDELRMSEPLEVLAPADCPSTLTLDADTDGDGTADATEERIFDSDGHLVAAELRSKDADPDKTRRRLLVTYDGQARAVRYLFGSEGTKSMTPFSSSCEAPPPDKIENPFLGKTRGTLIEVVPGSTGPSRVTTVSNETCVGSQGRVVCEVIHFDERGRFARRYRGCPGGARGGYEDPFDETLTRDAKGRKSEYRAVVQQGNQAGFYAGYGYPSATSTRITYSNDSMCGGGSSCSYEPVTALTRHHDADGHPTEETVDVGKDDIVDARMLRTFDADGCGYEERQDSEDDGLFDYTTRVSCAGGRIVHIDERNMTSSGRFAVSSLLYAPAQGTATADVDYDAAGHQLLRRRGQTERPAFVDESVYSATFTYAGAFGHSGDVRDRYSRNNPLTQSSECRMKRSCASSSLGDLDAALARCELGVGAFLVPLPFFLLPGFHSMAKTQVGLTDGWGSDYLQGPLRVLVVQDDAP